LTAAPEKTRQNTITIITAYELVKGAYLSSTAIPTKKPIKPKAPK
jgi:hypothetical protein